MWGGAVLTRFHRYLTFFGFDAMVTATASPLGVAAAGWVLGLVFRHGVFWVLS